MVYSMTKMQFISHGKGPHSFSYAMGTTVTFIQITVFRKFDQTWSCGSTPLPSNSATAEKAFEQNFVTIHPPKDLVNL